MDKKTRKPPAPIDQSVLPWLLAVALSSSVPHAAHLPAWLSTLAAGLLGWRLWLWHKHGTLPARWLLTMFVIGGCLGIASEYRTLFGRNAGVALLVLFMALKPMEMRSRRDALVIVMLGYFLLLTHFLYSETIPTGLWLFSLCTLLTATLIRLHGGPQPIRAIIRYAGLLLIQSLPFMLILFLLFPRISGPLWGLPQDAHSALTGLSDRMAPGTLSNLIQSGSIAFRVQFTGNIPKRADLYWRGPVLDEYDGINWRAGQKSTHTEPQTLIETEGPRIDYISTLEAHNQRWLLALDLPVALPPDTHFSPTFEALARTPLRNRTRFAFRSVPNFRANAVESSVRLEHALRLPSGLNPRTRALAASWQLLPTEQIAERALRMFREQPFYYTLRPPLLGRHAMDEFLFDSQRGFCEHYASAFTVLMRAAGIPARVVTGYQGGEINPVDGFLTVRQSDAHAWAEIWSAGRGWIRVDPTAAVAPSRIEQGIAAALPDDEELPVFARIDISWLLTLRNRWEAIDNAWNQWVLGYNPQRQKEMLSRLGLKDPNWRSMTTILTILCSIALATLSLWVLYQRRAIDPVQIAWLQFCKRLTRLGIERQPWEGATDFAARIALERPELGALAQEATEYYVALRYGRANSEDLKRLQACIDRLPIRWRRIA